MVGMLVPRLALAQELGPALQGLGFIQGVVEREAARKAEAERQRAIDEGALNMRERLGALAMDPEGTAYGMFTQAPGSGDRAEQLVAVARKAVEACEAQQPRMPCNFVTTFNFECLSIAWSANTMRPFWYSAFMLRAAEEFAMEKCEKGGGNCRLVKTECAIQQSGASNLLSLGTTTAGRSASAAELERINARTPMLGMFIVDPKATVLLGLLNQPYPGRGKRIEQLTGEVKLLTLINGNRQQAAAVLGNPAIDKTPVHVFANTCSAAAIPADPSSTAKDLFFADAPNPALAAELAKEHCQREFKSGCNASALSDEQACTGEFVRAADRETARGPVFGAVAVDQGVNGIAVVLNQTSRAQAKAAVEASTTLLAPLNGKAMAEATRLARSSPKTGVVTFANGCAGIAHPKAGARSVMDVFLLTDETADDARRRAKRRCESVTGGACVALEIPQATVCAGDYIKDLSENLGRK
ncbi:MAG: DUF4189 domain-containing protein [Pseudomonadota bacterium]|nr:DUF4189 domain-containing protein [Pseudomonadota bacterium]